jgi:hypothetical protein
MLNFNTMMTMTVLFLCSYHLPVQSAVVLNEIMSNVDGPDSGREGDQNEFIEIHNLSEEKVDLEGWCFSDDDATDYIQVWDPIVHGPLNDPDVMTGSAEIKGNGYAVILDPEYNDDEAGADQPYDFPPGTLVLTVKNTTLGDGLSTRDPIVLKDSSEQTVDTYGTPSIENDTIPFDPGDGYTVERIDPGKPDTEENWRASIDPGGTPGKANSVAGPFVDMGVQQTPAAILPEFPLSTDSIRISVTICNLGEVVLEGWTVQLYRDRNIDGEFTDDELLLDKGEKGLLPPADSLVVTVRCGPFPEGIHLVRISIFADEEKDLEDNDLFIRLNCGGELPRIVLNEVMFNPFDTSCEWVELYNRSGVPVDLHDWALSDSDTSKRYTIADGDLLLLPGNYLVVAKDDEVIEAQYSVAVEDVITPSDGFPSLNNSGDEVYLYERHRLVVDMMNYSTGADIGSGVSLERIDADMSTLSGDNWGHSSHFHGSTPGAENSIHIDSGVTKGGMELYPNPFSPDNDGYEDRMSIRVKTRYRHTRMSLSIYDIAGRPVRHLALRKEAGNESTFIWDGRDDGSRELPPGLYIICSNVREFKTGHTVRYKSLGALVRGI